MSFTPRFLGRVVVSFAEPGDLPGWDEAQHGPGARIEPCEGCPLCRVRGEPSGGGSPSPQAWARESPEIVPDPPNEAGVVERRSFVGGTPYYGPAPLCMVCWEEVRSLPPEEGGEE